MNGLFLFLYGFTKCRESSYLFLFLFEFSAHSVMSSGFEVRALTMDRNRLKRLRTNEDEEIFTIQVSKSVFSMHGMTIINWVIPTPIAFCRKGARKPGITLDSVSVDHLHVESEGYRQKR